MHADTPTCHQCGDAADFDPDACRLCFLLDVGRISRAEWDAAKHGGLSVRVLQRRLDARDPSGHTGSARLRAAARLARFRATLNPP